MFYAAGGAQGSAPGASMLSVKRFLNESVLQRLVSSCQLKFLNYFMLSVVQELSSSYATENEMYLSTFVTFCNP